MPWLALPSKSLKALVLGVIGLLRPPVVPGVSGIRTISHCRSSSGSLPPLGESKSSSGSYSGAKSIAWIERIE